MKFNIAAVTIAAMALGVTAAPAVDNTNSVVVRHEGRGLIGDIFSRGDSKDKDEKDDDKKDSKKKSKGDDDKKSKGDDDKKDSKSGKKGSSSTKTKGSSGSKATAASSAGTTGSVSSGSSSGGKVPQASGTSVLSAAQTVAAGKTFDGGMKMFDRGVKCTGQKEGGDKDAVFQIEHGGSLSNVIIGPNQIEGIHCQGACTLTNVWWSAVCEDAFTIKTQAAGETTKISGGGAFGASDKVIQHNGAGTVAISDFTVGDFGKLYRSCGNCKTMYERHVTIDGVTATSGKLLAGINSNYGDTATITNTKASGVKDICEQFKGNDSGAEPTKISSGADGKFCKYGADVAA